MNCFICSVENPEFFWTVTDSKTIGSNIVLQKFTGNPEQQFQIFTNYIIAGCSGLSIDLSGGVKEGAALIQWDFHGKANQIFHTTPDQNIRCQNINIGANAIAANEKLIAMKPNGKNNHQKWRFVTRKP